MGAGASAKPAAAAAPAVIDKGLGPEYSVTLNTPLRGIDQGRKCRLRVAYEALALLDAAEETVLAHFPYQTIVCWGYNLVRFVGGRRGADGRASASQRLCPALPPAQPHTPPPARRCRRRPHLRRPPSAQNKRTFQFKRFGKSKKVQSENAARVGRSIYPPPPPPPPPTVVPCGPPEALAFTPAKALPPPPRLCRGFGGHPRKRNPVQGPRVPRGGPLPIIQYTILEYISTICFFFKYFIKLYYIIMFMSSYIRYYLWYIY